MDGQPVAADDRSGARTFSFSRFGVMLALFATPALAGSWYIMQQLQPPHQPAQAAPRAAMPVVASAAKSAEAAHEPKVPPGDRPPPKISLPRTVETPAADPGPAEPTPPAGEVIVLTGGKSAPHMPAADEPPVGGDPVKSPPHMPLALDPPAPEPRLALAPAPADPLPAMPPADAVSAAPPAAPTEADPFKVLAADLNRAFPEAHIELRLLGRAVLVFGRANSAREAAHILRIVVANTPWASGVWTPPPVGTPQEVGSGSPHVVNLLQVAGARQVTLRIAVAEMTRPAACTLESGIIQVGAVERPGGRPVARLLKLPCVPHLPTTFGGARCPAPFSCCESPAPAGEPQRISVNGQAATLLARGEFPVPLVGGAAVTLGLYGIEMTFAPVEADRDRLVLKVSATGSPGADPHPFAATIALHEGQTYALCGLVPSPAYAGSAPPSSTGRAALLPASGGDQEVVILIVPEFTGTR
jgi:hypothetical protein